MADLPRLVCASANPDKVAEIASSSDGLVDLQPRPAGLGDVVEDAPDLEGNARLKAVAVCEAAGALRSATTPASRSMRSTVRRASSRLAMRATMSAIRTMSTS